MEDTFINLDCGVLYEGFIWGMHLYGNDFYKISIENGKVEYVCTFARLKNERHLFRKIVEHKGKLLLIPGTSPYIALFDIQTGEIKYFAYHAKCDHFAKFSSFHIWGGYAYFFPAQEKHILKLNLDTMEMQYLHIPLHAGEEHVRFGRGGIMTDDGFLVPCMNRNAFLQLKENGEECEWVETGLDGPAKCVANTDRGDYVLLANNQIWKWGKGQTEKLPDRKTEYIEIIGSGNGIWCVPYGKDKFEAYNLDTREWEQFDFPGFYRVKDRGAEAGNGKVPVNKDVVRNKNCFCIVPRFSNAIIKIDLKKRGFTCVKMSADGKIRKRIIMDIVKSTAVVEESDIGLENFLMLLPEFEEPEKSAGKHVGTGSKIYQRIMGS